MAKKKINKVSLQNLRPNLKGKPASSLATCPPEWHTFACYTFFLKSLGKAAEAMEWRREYGYELAKKPIVKQLIELVKAGNNDSWPRELKLAWDASVKCVYVTENLLDENLMRAVKSPDHERRGLADVVAAIKVGYERIGLIGKSGTTVINQNSNQVGVSATSSSYEVYESEWLRERNRGWQKQLEEKHGNDPTETE
jgi:hypothetical protein